MLNRHFAAAAACLALFACKGEATPTDDTDTTTPPPACETVSDAFPGDGAVGVYYRTAFTWTFTAQDTSAMVTLSDGTNEVSGSGSWIGNTYVWEPATALMPSTQYTADLTYCDGEQTASTSFTTSAVGTATDVSTLPGKTFELNLTADDVNFIEPPGVGGLLQSQLGDVSVLVGVESADAANIQMIGALGDGSTPQAQDLCTPSIPFPAADFGDNPYFEIGPENTTLSVAGYSVSIDQLKISGAFDESQTVVAGAVLEGSIDTRPLVELLQPGGGDDAVCTLVGNFGIACQDCGGGEMYCLSIKVNNINADVIDGLTLVERLQADIDADTTCTPAP